MSEQKTWEEELAEMSPSERRRYQDIDTAIAEFDDEQDEWNQEY